jgi:hypothetical protein
MSNLEALFHPLEYLLLDLNELLVFARVVQAGYRRINSTPTLTPKTAGFVFDRELRSESDTEKLRAKSSAIHFLGRRTFENYLLHAPSIAEVLAASGVAPEGLLDRIVSWISSNVLSSKYFEGVSDEFYSSDNINAPLLLEDLFWEMSGRTLEFRKTTHTVALAQAVLTNSPEMLREVMELVERILRG